MGLGREDRVQRSLSPGGSPVKQPRKRIKTVRRFPYPRPEWLNDDNSDFPLLRSVFQARIAPSNITIPGLTVTGNPFAHPVEQG